MAMTTRKRRFADAILKGLKPTEAAARAGYSGKTARVKGWQLVRDPAVKKYLAALTGGATFPVTQPRKVTKKFIIKNHIKNITYFSDIWLYGNSEASLNLPKKKINTVVR